MGRLFNKRNLLLINKNIMMYGLYNGSGGWLGGGIMMIVFWGLVIWVIVYLIRGSHGKGHHMCGHSHDKEVKDNSPLNTLQGRYAKGEIDKKEFEEKKRDLSNSL